MKLTAILLTACFLQASANGFSQKISFAGKEVSLEKVFMVIEQQTGYVVFYNYTALKGARPVTVNVKGMRLEQFLNECFNSQPFRYAIEGKTILITKKDEPSPAAATPPPPADIHGRITDSEGNPVVGATVAVKGTKTGTVSDAGGGFNIRASRGDVLVFSYIGYQTEESVVRDNLTINIQLRQANSGLNELVVVGYGAERKADLTGAIANISSKQLADRPITNITSALQGAMPGVTVVQNNGQPGKDNGVINIRGIGTLNNSNPMVVVDGVISTLTDINPDDIASVTVLKDAASASIYGSRAANGVVLITTKQGVKGKLSLHYNAYVGKQTPTRLPDFIPSWQAATLYNQVLQNESKPIRYSDADIQNFKNGSDPDKYPNTDWLDLLYRGNGVQQNHYIDLSGGDDKTQYMFSLGYFNQDGVVKNFGNDRYTTRLNLTSHVSKRLTINGKIAYSQSIFKEPNNPYTGTSSQIFVEAMRIGRNVPYKYSNGYYGYVTDGNPIAWIDLGGTNNNTLHNLLGIADADLEIVKGLHFKPMFSYQLTINQTKNFVKDIQFYDHTTGDPTVYEGPNSLTDYNDFNNVVTLQALLDYDKTFKNQHHIHLLGGYSQEYSKFSWLQGYRKNFLNNSLSELNAGPTDAQAATGSANELGLRSFFGRFNYAYEDKYLLEANLRYDGSSRFASENRWGLYPSVSAGWNISQEPFFDPLKDWFSNLKFRGSWGRLGNQNITGDYPSITTISAGQNYEFNNSIAAGIAPVNGANGDIKWETTEQTDIGLDAGFLKRKLTLTADYFIKNTSDILLNVPVSAAYGLNAPVQNVGAVRNRGWEFSMTYADKKGAFSYNVSLNTSFIKNEVTDLHGTGPIINGYSFMQVGYPINSFYGYACEGIFQTQDQVDKHAKESGGTIAPGDLMYKDQNGDGVIDGADRVYLGSYFPKVTFGLNINVEWKGLDMTVFLQGATGVKGFITDELLGEAGDQKGKPTSILLDAWTPENHSTKFPRLWSTYTQNNASTNPSSFWVRNASYARLKNLQVGYTLPQQWTKRAGLQRVRIYYSGQNILTMSSFYKWVDPEAPAGERGYTYPQVLVNTVGINLFF